MSEFFSQNSSGLIRPKIPFFLLKESDSILRSDVETSRKTQKQNERRSQHRNVPVYCFLKYRVNHPSAR